MLSIARKGAGSEEHKSHSHLPDYQYSLTLPAPSPRTQKPPVGSSTRWGDARVIAAIESAI